MAQIPENVRNAVSEEFARLNREVKLLFFFQAFECPHCEYERDLLNELVKYSDKIILEVYDFQKDVEKVKQYKIDKIPALVVEGVKDCGIRYFGVPSGYEFGSLIGDIIDVSRGSTDLTEETKSRLKNLTKIVHIQILVSLT
jgi:alkyl hydroperoxide reductase subunit AhpF